MKPDTNDAWLWIVEEELVQALLRNDVPKPDSARREVDIPELARAIGLSTEGRALEALEQVTKALQQHPGSTEAWWARAQLEFELGRFDEAQKSYSEVIARRQPPHWAAFFNRALCLEKLGKLEEATHEFSTAAGMSPERAETLLALGVCLLRWQKPAAAMESFDACLRPNPGNDRALFGKAVALQMLDRHDEALEIYRTILPQHANNVDLLVNLIAVAIARRDDVHVRDYCEKLLSVRPQARPALEGLATLALAAGDYEAAVRFCSELVKVAPDSFEAWYNLAFAHHKSSRPDKAITAYAEAIRLRPDSDQAHANLGLVLQEGGDAAGARREYRESLRLNPAAPAVLWNLAALAERSAEPAEAEAALAKLVELKPDWEDASFRLGCLRLQLDNPAGAAEAFENCLRRRADWAEAHLNLAVALWRAGDRGRARMEIETAAMLKPKSTAALRAQAVIALEENDIVRALETVDKLREVGEKAPDVLYNAGILLQQAGDHDGAARAFRQAVDDRPDFAEAMLNLGHALESLGQHEEAVVCWKEAVVKRPELAQSYF